MELRARPDWGALPLEPDSYGTSVNGLPLHVWRPRAEAIPELTLQPLTVLGRYGNF